MVTRADAARLLALVQAFDHRNVAETDVHAWADALADLDPEDCQAAIRSYFRDQTAWLMPAMVRQRVKAIRETAAERAHRQNLRQQIEAPRDPQSSKLGYLTASNSLAAALGKPTSADREIADEARAREVRCRYEHCRAGVGQPCHTNGVVRSRSHPSRLEAALGGPLLPEAS